MTTRRTFASLMAALGVVNLLRPTSAKADGAIQTVTNHGQIVSTGDVNVRQAAGGQQYIYDQYGTLIAVQDVGNDLQVVSTGNVNADQSAAGAQAAIGGGYSSGGVCTPGDYYEEAGCVYFCSTDGCTWYSHCCKSCPKPKGKCCK